jgi:hypothetical protein
MSLPLTRKIRIWILDVLPGKSLDNTVYGISINPKQSSQRPTGFPVESALTNFQCRGFIELCLRMAGALGGSALQDHISHIFGLRAKEQVVGTDTSSSVTFVQHVHSWWNRAKMDFPGKPMGCIWSSVNANIAVSFLPLSINASSPKPALIGLYDLFPKPFLRRLVRTALGGAPIGAIHPPSVIDLKGCCAERIPAQGAKSFDIPLLHQPIIIYGLM